MFVVALVTFKSHCYFLKIYLPCKKYRSSKSKRWQVDLLDLFFETVISCIPIHNVLSKFEADLVFLPGHNEVRHATKW